MTIATGLQASERVVVGVIGDYGTPGHLTVANVVKNWNPDFIITVGDNNYGLPSEIDQNIGSFYHDYIHPYVGIYGSGGSSNRFFPTLGNHDTPQIQSYLDYFTLPGNERYYSFRYGPVQFFALNSNPEELHGNTNGSVQAQWLQTQLAASTTPWKLVYFHHPPYSSGAYGPGVLDLRWPFAAWGASVVLTGHDHTYERLHTNNMVYFINGLGGLSIYPFTMTLPGSQVRFNSDYGAMRIEATGTNLLFQFVTQSNIVVDSFKLRKSGMGSPLVSDPTDQIALLGRSATFDVFATGAGSLRYQWQFGSANIAGATNRFLVISNVQFAHEGDYAVIVSNASGSTHSDPAQLSVLRHPLIMQQPANQIVRLGSNVTFRVEADGYGPLLYRWFFNGAVILGATNSTLTLTNAQFSDTGDYSVVVTDELGSIQSDLARLKVIAVPIFIQHPLSQTAVVGETVVLSALAHGTVPMTNQWRVGTRGFPITVATQGLSFLTLTNVQMTNAGTYVLWIRNEASLLVPSSNAVLTVLTDRDGDGMPDEWEFVNGFEPDNGNDAGDDADLDNQSNRNEYLAGTDPYATNSLLKIDHITPVSPGKFILQFTAVSNKTYSVEFHDGPEATNWNRLAEFVATATNRQEVIQIIAPSSNGQRFYRLITPRLPKQL